MIRGVIFGMQSFPGQIALLDLSGAACVEFLNSHLKTSTFKARIMFQLSFQLKIFENAAIAGRSR